MKDDPREKAAFSKIMLGIAENFSAQMSSPGLNLRFLALKEFSLEQIETAAMKILTSRKAMGMPTVAEFMLAINGDQRASDKAEGQAVEVIKQIRSVGSYGSPVFNDPITRALMCDRWSFRSLCSMTETELKWWFKEFVDAYQASERRGECLALESRAEGKGLRLLPGGLEK
jgi:hypothetical protein